MTFPGDWENVVALRTSVVEPVHWRGLLSNNYIYCIPLEKSWNVVTKEEKMSLSTMTNDLARPGSQQFVEAIGAENVPQGAIPVNSAAKKAFDAIAKFIPTEVLAPFLMMMELIKKEELSFDAKTVYWAFVLLTPLMLVLFEYAKSAEAGVSWPDVRQVIWRALGATIAFAVWSLAVPGNPYQQLVGGIAMAGMLAVLISPLLSAVDVIVIKLIKPAD